MQTDWYTVYEHNDLAAWLIVYTHSTLVVMASNQFLSVALCHQITS